MIINWILELTSLEPESLTSLAFEEFTSFVSNRGLPQALLQGASGTGTKVGAMEVVWCAFKTVMA